MNPGIQKNPAMFAIKENQEVFSSPIGSIISSVVSSITGVNTAVFEIINTTTVFGIHCKISKPVRLQYYTIQLILYKSNCVQPTSLSLPLPHCHYLYYISPPLIIQNL